MSQRAVRLIVREAAGETVSSWPVSTDFTNARIALRLRGRTGNGWNEILRLIQGSIDGLVSGWVLTGQTFRGHQGLGEQTGRPRPRSCAIGPASARARSAPALDGEDRWSISSNDVNVNMHLIMFPGLVRWAPSRALHRLRRTETTPSILASPGAIGVDHRHRVPHHDPVSAVPSSAPVCLPWKGRLLDLNRLFLAYDLNLVCRPADLYIFGTWRGYAVTDTSFRRIVLFCWTMHWQAARPSSASWSQSLCHHGQTRQILPRQWHRDFSCRCQTGRLRPMPRSVVFTELLVVSPGGNSFLIACGQDDWCAHIKYAGGTTRATQFGRYQSTGSGDRS